MRVEVRCEGAKLLPLDDLHEFQGNLKDLSKENYEKFKQELLDLGFSEPVSVWNLEGRWMLLNGHQRLRTLRAMKQEGIDVPRSIPVSVVQAKDIEEAKKKVLSLTSQYGQITKDGLYEFMSEAGLEMEDIENFRFPEIDLDNFGEEFFEEQEPAGDPDAVPELPVAPKSKLGDLWTLGNHRLLCGDSTFSKDVQRLMAGELAHMVFTDPPYNVDYAGSDGQKIQNDNMADEKFLEFCRGFYQQLFNSLDVGGAIYVFHADTNGDAFRRAFKEVGFKLASTLIWNKSSLIMGRSDYHWKHEPCLYGWKPGAAHSWYSDRRQTTVYDHAKGSGEDNKMHPTSKPVSLVEYFVGNSSKKGDLVLDLFGGSGSTLIASERLGRSSRLMELDPKYVDVIIQRWAAYTGQDPVREDGKKWSEL